MVNVLLVDLKCRQLIHGEWVPLGLMRIARYLSDHGVHVDVKTNCAPDDAGLSQAIAKADVIGFGCTTMQLRSAEALSRKIMAEHPDKITVVGGQGIYGAKDKEALPFHHVVVGAGETAMLELANGEQAEKIIQGGRASEYIPFDLRWVNVFAGWPIDNQPALGILTSEGCVGKCKFCCGPVACGSRWTPYPIQDVVENMKYLEAQTGIRRFRIWDDCFTMNRQRCVELCQAMEENRWIWTCQSRADTVDEELLRLMKRAGCAGITVGVESADEGILKTCGKTVSPDKAREGCTMIVESGILLDALYVLGLPGETKETALKTMQLAREIGGRPYVQMFKPYPGTDFYDEIMAGRHGKLLRDPYEQGYDNESVPFLPSGMTEAEMWEMNAKWGELQAELKRREQAGPPPQLKIQIGMPSSSGPALECFSSIISVMQHCLRATPHAYNFALGKRMFIHFARRSIVEAALSCRADYVLFLDDDMIFPPNTITRLIAVAEKFGVDCVSGLYCRRGQPHETFIMFREGNSDRHSMYMPRKDQRNTLMECDATGLGCCLIRTSVFERVPRPWFELPDGQTEDVYFFKKMNAAGIRCHIDTGIACGHIGTMGVVFPYKTEFSETVDRYHVVYADEYLAEHGLIKGE